MEKTRVLIFLDAVVDTRLGCVRVVNDDWTEDMIRNGYVMRLSNKLSRLNPAIDDTLVNERWENRDVEVLKQSFATEVLHRLALLSKEGKKFDPEHPGAFNVELTLNIWPYQLSESERNMFLRLIMEILRLDTINCISRPMAACSPGWIKENFDQAIIYDMNEWVCFHYHELGMVKMPEVIMTWPLCFQDHTPESEMNHKEAIFNLELSFAGSFIPDIVPLKTFSVVGST